MKIFRKWFLKHWVQAQRDYNSDHVGCGEIASARNLATTKASSVSISSNIEVRGMNFTVYKANGGHVLEYRYYNESTDRHEGSLHLIPAGEDMGKTIEHAITAEMLKR